MQHKSAKDFFAQASTKTLASVLRAPNAAIAGERAQKAGFTGKLDDLQKSIPQQLKAARPKSSIRAAGQGGATQGGATQGGGTQGGATQGGATQGTGKRGFSGSGLVFRRAVL